MSKSIPAQRDPFSVDDKPSRAVDRILRNTADVQRAFWSLVLGVEVKPDGQIPGWRRYWDDLSFRERNMAEKWEQHAVVEILRSKRDSAAVLHECSDGFRAELAREKRASVGLPEGLAPAPHARAGVAHE